MPEPMFEPIVESLWSRLPDIYRQLDAMQDRPIAPIPEFPGDPGGYPLKRYIGSLLGSAAEIEVLFNRFKYVTPDAGGAANSTSDLVDPHTADDAWLPWIAQLLGARTGTEGFTNAQLRELLYTPELAYGAGTAAAVAAAAQRVLTGTKYISIYNHTTDVSAAGAAGEWDVLIVTRGSETTGNVIQSVKDAGAKPAGVVLWHRTFDTTWNNIEAAYTTWAPIDALPNWTELEETGL